MGTYGTGAAMTTTYEHHTSTIVYGGIYNVSTYPYWLIFKDESGGGGLDGEIHENANRAYEGKRFAFIPTTPNGVCSAATDISMGGAGSCNRIEQGITYCFGFYTAAIDKTNLNGSSTQGAGFSLDFSIRDASNSNLTLAAGDLQIVGTPINGTVGSLTGTSIHILTKPDNSQLYQNYNAGLTWEYSEVCFKFNHLPTGTDEMHLYLSTTDDPNGNSEKGIAYDNITLCRQEPFNTTGCIDITITKN